MARQRRLLVFLAMLCVGAGVVNGQTPTSNARSGSSRRVFPDGRVLLGAGYSRLAGVSRHAAMDRPAGGTVSTADNQIDYDFRLVESYSDLAQALSIDASASFESVTGGASARYSLYRSAKIDSRSVYVLIRMSVQTGTEQLSAYRFSDDALRLLGRRDPDNFFATFGDGFVYRIGYGAELVALLNYHVTREEDREEVAAEVNGRYGAFKAGASFASSVSSITGGRDVTVQYAQSGADTGQAVQPPAFTPSTPPATPSPMSGGVLTITPEELEYRIRSFPKEARANRDNSVVVWTDVLDYYAVVNRPTFVFFDSTKAAWTLEELAEYARLLDQTRNSWFDLATTQPAGSNVTIHDVYCLDDFARTIRRAGETLLQSPGEATVIRQRLQVLPASADLREYVHRLLAVSGVTSQATAAPEFCNLISNGNLKGAESYIVTRTLPSPGPAFITRTEVLQYGMLDILNKQVTISLGHTQQLTQVWVAVTAVGEQPIPYQTVPMGGTIEFPFKGAKYRLRVLTIGEVSAWIRVDRE